MKDRQISKWWTMDVTGYKNMQTCSEKSIFTVTWLTMYSQAADEILLVKLKYFYKTEKYSFEIGKIIAKYIYIFLELFFFSLIW